MAHVLELEALEVKVGDTLAAIEDLGVGTELFPVSVDVGRAVDLWQG